MSTWAYDLSHEELVRKYGNACARVGGSNPALVVDMMRSHYVHEANYYEGVLLARFAGKKPPVSRGSMVRFRKNEFFGQYVEKVKPEQIHIIERVWYCSGYKGLKVSGEDWYITLHGLEDHEAVPFSRLEIIADLAQVAEKAPLNTVTPQ